LHPYIEDIGGGIGLATQVYPNGQPVGCTGIAVQIRFVGQLTPNKLDVAT